MEKKDGENKREHQPASCCYREGKRGYGTDRPCVNGIPQRQIGAAKPSRLHEGENVESFGFARHLISLVMCNARDQF